MKLFICGMAFLAALAAPVAAETRYDRNIEKAAMDIVAGKMGNIRGGFSYKQRPQLVVLPDAPPPAPVPVEPPHKEASGSDGLMPAVERQVSRTVF
ncbi:hypothetical protein EN828_04170 [Mesorhizobium sp. M2D.F.Ca.ET.185.01.1.1]|uniref:hypothetical protein n=1 Tax=unclassified Mesorhizobium TaxID=325217 RepID=UPI000FCB42C0|nr:MULTISPECIES: hypothetical protein [unclassified Mesorhizobium]NUS18767.1 hypothetical protein [Mesorhizobium sp.]TGP56854.1 hypothetical protein EN873_01680 [bacterium M00.F.Ca.ET.230.01.1.1]TGP75525.1 hypothetical protein EN870_25020 [bacterium M00.F.Ca.ET.227.01.1.1]TGP90403.1 hypothetical protein EN865_24425 [bacterium M00.F.Ca.ET.222.01.1.1]TGP96549.1 hypothetical protein EN864_08685 [bacterium M00.F.Ca.ET.221.01.1.1]TGT68930.1 hypothetical protein EN802_24870 [bacterium M00.F.Ca.ET.1